MTDNLLYVSDVQLANQDLTLKGIPMKLNHAVDKKLACPPTRPMDFVDSMLSSARGTSADNILVSQFQKCKQNRLRSLTSLVLAHIESL